MSVAEASVRVGLLILSLAGPHAQNRLLPTPFRRQRGPWNDSPQCRRSVRQRRQSHFDRQLALRLSGYGQGHWHHPQRRDGELAIRGCLSGETLILKISTIRTTLLRQGFPMLSDSLVSFEHRFPLPSALPDSGKSLSAHHADSPPHQLHLTTTLMRESARYPRLHL